MSRAEKREVNRKSQRRLKWFQTANDKADGRHTTDDGIKFQSGQAAHRWGGFVCATPLTILTDLLVSSTILD
jgi:hypothetical protein